MNRIRRSWQNTAVARLLVLLCFTGSRVAAQVPVTTIAKTPPEGQAEPTTDKTQPKGVAETTRESTPLEGSPESAAASQAEPTREQELPRELDALKERLKAIEEQLDQKELEDLLSEAKQEAQPTTDSAKPEEREFLEGGLALQKLNPELTFCGDMLSSLVLKPGKYYASEFDRSEMPIRSVGLHFQHVLDPYSMFKSALHIGPNGGLDLEEAYVTWFGVLPSVSLSAGRFRQNFGVVNRWHEHDLDQTQYPLALEAVLGEEGLVGNGVSIKWLMPKLWAHANELSLEVVDGRNETLFAGEHFSVPSTMLRLKNYYDLSAATYIELGLTGMFGINNRRGFLSKHQLLDEPWRKTIVAGADLTLFWSPPERARYQSFTWRSEFYYANREQAKPRDSDAEHSWGVYSYVQQQLSSRWVLGVRGDVALPTVRSDNLIAADVVPYVTFLQSEFVFLRLEYRHVKNLPYVTAERDIARRTDDRILFQVSFAAGPHKHDKY